MRQLYDPRDGARYPLRAPRWRSDAGRPLLITPGPGLARDDVIGATRSLWRYRAAIAGDIARPITLGEGRTPLIARDWGDLRPLFKCEGANPTGSFKDRGASVMLSFLREIGVDAVLEDSSGNGGAAIAGYGAAGGVRVKVLAPSSTSQPKIAQARAYGAEVELVPGPREATAEEAVRQSEAIFYASHNWHAFFLEGVKTLAFELWEDLAFTAPDNVVLPVGAGSLLIGCWFGFAELVRAGAVPKAPRLFAAQPRNCSPVVAAFDGVAAADWRPTIAEGTAIKAPLRLDAMLTALRETGGRAVAVEEAEIVACLRRLARAGFFVEPTCAVAVAGLERLAASGAIAPRETTVVVLSGTGLKAAATVAELTAGG